jgi:hypothetical protein|tara:strand:- start:413 stop:664 length:252 start_codon:yes stop_codon:yes gene_type:complete
MSKHNDTFKLDVEDLDIIEHALRMYVAKLSRRHTLDVTPTDANVRVYGEGRAEGTELSKIENLLGRLHDQKQWYRPKGSYISG